MYVTNNACAISLICDALQSGMSDFEFNKYKNNSTVFTYNGGKFELSHDDISVVEIVIITATKTKAAKAIQRKLRNHYSNCVDYTKYMR